MKKIEKLKCPICGAEMKEEYLIRTHRFDEGFQDDCEDEVCLLCPNCFITKNAFKRFILTDYVFSEEEEDNDDYDFLYKDFLEINGNLNILFFDEFNERIPYKKFVSEYEKYDFINKVNSLIIKSDKAISFANKLFKEEDKPFIETGIYKYSLGDCCFLKYEDALERFQKEWKPLLKLV